jgi:hypothetical protein
MCFVGVFAEVAEYNNVNKKKQCHHRIGRCFLAL